MLSAALWAGEVRISAGLEAALAPAMLPRTWLTQRLLQELREVCSFSPLPHSAPTLSPNLAYTPARQGPSMWSV